jgi:hypothetical protein
VAAVDQNIDSLARGAAFRTKLAKYCGVLGRSQKSKSNSPTIMPAATVSATEFPPSG